MLTAPFRPLTRLGLALAVTVTTILLTGCPPEPKTTGDPPPVIGVGPSEPDTKGGTPPVIGVGWKRPVPPPNGTLLVIVVDETASFRRHWEEGMGAAAQAVRRLGWKDAVMVIGADVHAWDEEDVRIPVTAIPASAMKAAALKRSLGRSVRELKQRPTSSGSEEGYKIAMAHLARLKAARKKQSDREHGAVEEPEDTLLGTDLMGAIDYAAYLAGSGAGGRVVDLLVISDFAEEPGQQPPHEPVPFPEGSRFRALYVSTGAGGDAYTAVLERWREKLRVYGLEAQEQDFLLQSQVAAMFAQ